MSYYGWTNDSDAGERIFETYLRGISQIADELLSEGCVLRLLVGESSDQTAVERLVAMLGARKGMISSEQLVVEPIHDFDDLLAQIALVDVVVSTRFHNVVGSLMMSRPLSRSATRTRTANSWRDSDSGHTATTSRTLTPMRWFGTYSRLECSQATSEPNWTRSISATFERWKNNTVRYSGTCL